MNPDLVINHLILTKNSGNTTNELIYFKFRSVYNVVMKKDEEDIKQRN
jgi:hypothetical protein